MNKPVPPSTSRKALGRGLDALLAPSRAAAPASSSDGSLRHLPLNAVVPNPLQPRRSFDEAELAELAASIRTHGVLQPILVRPFGAVFELIAGERRLRAARLAGLNAIPALLQTFGDQASLEVAIIENLQRADLNPVEEAEAFAELAGRFHLVQETLAEKTGKDRATIANSMRLLRLDAQVLDLVRSRSLTPGQARPLLALDSATQRLLAQQIAEEGWSARRIEQHVAQLQAHPPKPAKAAPPRDPNERDAETQLAHALGAKVRLKTSRGHRGTIEISFAGLEDFQRLFERLLHG